MLNIAAVFVTFCCLSSTGQPLPQTVESFEKVWNTVEERHWDPKHLERLPNGKSWTQIHEQYRRLIENTKTDREARSLIHRMLGLLGQSHYAVLSGGTNDDLTPVNGGLGTIGIDPMLVEGKMLVRRVDTGSPAAAQKIGLGWEIREIDGFDVQGAVARITARKDNVREPEVLLRMLVAGHLSGIPGSHARVAFLDGNGSRVERTFQRAEPAGAPTQFGFLPPMVVDIESTRLRQDTGYFRFNAFLDPAKLMARFRESVADCLKCRGFVIDVRGNPGGLAILAPTMAGFFIDKPDTKLGTLYQRNLTLKLTVNPRLEMFKGRLAVLVDAASVSTSEILAGGLQDLKRGRIFGTRTAGAALPSMIERLPNGDLFQYAIANYISEGGKSLEGRGVIPDTLVTTTRAALLAGRDPVLDAALDWIHAPKP